MTKLGVNIDHSATLRQARYRESLDNPDVIVEPNPAEIALAAERGGADSITATCAKTDATCRTPTSPNCAEKSPQNST